MTRAAPLTGRSDGYLWRIVVGLVFEGARSETEDSQMNQELRETEWNEIVDRLLAIPGLRDATEQDKREIRDCLILAYQIGVKDGHEIDRELVEQLTSECTAVSRARNEALGKGH